MTETYSYDGGNRRLPGCECPKLYVRRPSPHVLSNMRCRTANSTGKERDSESGLDNFGARYNSSQYGRFMNPDPKGIGLRHLLNPQKLNKYGYVLNNPMSLFDPNGMEEVTMQLNAFIQQNSVGGFRGDNRG